MAAGMDLDEDPYDAVAQAETAARWLCALEEDAPLPDPVLACRVHHAMGAWVRARLLRAGATPPERLPTPAVSRA